MPTSKTWPSGIVNVTPATFQIPIAGELNWAALSDFLNALADGAQSTTFQKFAIRVAATSPVTLVAPQDAIVAVDLTIPGASTVNLPAGSDKQVFFIIDGNGDAGTNNITIVPNGTDTIRGGASLVLANNGAAVMVAYNAADTDWKVIGPTLLPGTINLSDIVAVPADANKAIVRDAVGAVISAFITDVNVAAAAAIARSKLASGTPGYVVINNGGGVMSEEAALASSRGGLGTNASAFTGVVHANAGVFTASPVVDADVGAAAAINATKIADGSVDNTEFQRLGTAGTNGAGNLVTTDGTQTLTNKTISGANNTITNVSLTTGVTGILPIANGGTNAATANAALNNLLPTQTGNAGRVLGTDGTNTSWTAAGSGSGGINLVNSPSTADGWTETGTVFNTPVTTTTAGDLPLTPEVTTAIQFVATGSGTEATNYNSYSFTVPPALGVKLGISLFLRPGTGFAASEWTLSIYTAGGVRQSLSTDSAGVSYLPNTTGQFVSSFDAVAGTSYTVRIARTAGAGSATLNVAEVNVGTAAIVQGAMVGPPVVLAAAVSSNSQQVGKFAIGAGTTAPALATTVQWNEASYYRDGQYMYGNFAYAHNNNAGATAGTGNYLFILPSGLTIDSTVLSVVGNTSRAIVGSAQVENAANPLEGTVYVASSIALSLTVGDATNNPSTIGSAFINFTNSSYRIGFNFKVPIAEWAGSGTVNLAANNIAYYSAVTNSAGNWVASSTLPVVQGPGGSLCGTNTIAGTRSEYTITPAYPIPTGAKPIIEISSNGINWFPPGGFNGTFLVENLRFDGTNYIGAGVSQNASGQLLVTFGKYTSGSTNSWNTVIYWRVTVGLPGQAVGFGEVVPGVSSGLVSAQGLKGSTSGTLGVDYVGYSTSQSRLRSASTALTTDVAVNVTATPLTLPAGKWMIYAFVGYTPAGTTSVSDYRAAVSLTSATLPSTDTMNVPSAAGEFRTQASFAANVPSGVDYTLNVGGYPVDLTASTTFYLIGRSAFGVSTNSVYGSITAVRRA